MTCSSDSTDQLQHLQEQDCEVRKGPWTMEEDLILVNYISTHGEGVWNNLARSAGLKRTGKSCRLRWLNYLRPDIRRGNITPEEKLLIVDLQARWGNRWSKIAKQMPGRTDNEIKNYWRTRIQRKVKQPRDVGYNNNAYHQAPDGLQKYSNYQNSIVDYPPKPSMLTLLTDEGSTSQTRTIDGEMLIPCTPLFAESGTTHHHQQQLGFPDQNPSLDQSNDGLWGVDDLWSMHLFNNVDLANLPS